jgi:hypothetical protein
MWLSPARARIIRQGSDPLFDPIFSRQGLVGIPAVLMTAFNFHYGWIVTLLDVVDLRDSYPF